MGPIPMAIGPSGEAVVREQTGIGPAILHGGMIGPCNTEGPNPAPTPAFAIPPHFYVHPIPPGAPTLDELRAHPVAHAAWLRIGAAADAIRCKPELVGEIVTALLASDEVQGFL